MRKRLVLVMLGLLVTLSVVFANGQNEGAGRTSTASANPIVITFPIHTGKGGEFP